MKKQIILLVTMIVVILVGCTATFATSNLKEWLQTEDNTTALKQESVIKIDTYIEEMAQKVKSASQKFDFVSLMEEKGLYLDEISDTMVHFFRLNALYQFEERDIHQLYLWIREGYDFKKLLEIYEFAQDTDRPRDWQFVKQIYDKSVEIRIYGKNWIEGAFNALTENRGGVLGDTDIIRYINNGITAEEIQIANIMSRKGQKTIQEILDGKLSGKTWAQISEEVYVEEGLKAEAFHNVTKATDIYNKVVLADVADMDVNSIVLDDGHAYQKMISKNRAAKKAMSDLAIPSKTSKEVVSFAKKRLPDLSEQEIKELLSGKESIRNLEIQQKKAREKGVSLSAYLGGKAGNR